MKRSIIQLMFLVVISLAITLNLSVAAEKPIKIKYGHLAPAKPFRSAFHAAAVGFKHVMEQRSGGRFQVDIYPSGTLGKELNMMEAVKKNVIQVHCATPGGLYRIFPPGILFFTPYLFKNEEIAVEFLDGPFAQKLLDTFTEKIGIKGLDITPKYSYLTITNNVRPIRSPADMKGIKFRGMDTLQVTMFKSLGASGVPIAFPELYTSLQTGVVQGQTNSSMIVSWSKFWEVQKYLTVAKSQFASTWIVANKEWYDALSPADKKIVHDACKAAVRASIGLSVVLETTCLDEIKEKMDVIVLSDEEILEFKKIAQPACVKWLKTQMDPKYVDGLLEAVQETEKKMGY
ncbi:MAG: TRAP transporter substrate-binding protein DctP [Candidatus Hodarchaeota archaeon]